MSKLQSWLLVIGVMIIAANTFEWTSWKRTIAEVIRPNHFSIASSGCGELARYIIREIDGKVVGTDCRLRSRIADYFEPPPEGYEGVWFGDRPKAKAYIE